MKRMSYVVNVMFITLSMSAGASMAGIWTPAALPDSSASDPQWVLNIQSGGSASNATLVEDEYLRIDIMDDDGPYHRYDLTGANAVAAGAELNGANEVVQTKLRIVDRLEGTYDRWVASFLVYTDPGENDQSDGWFLRVAEGEAGVGWPRDEMAWYTLDTSVWHTYRMEIDAQARTGNLFIDGVLMGEMDRFVSSVSNVGIYWGDGSSDTGGIMDWASVAWGDDAKIPEPSSFVLIGIGLLSLVVLRRKRTC